MTYKVYIHIYIVHIYIYMYIYIYMQDMYIDAGHVQK